jgi:hypothetical protein
MGHRIKTDAEMDKISRDITAGRGGRSVDVTPRRSKVRGGGRASFAKTKGGAGHVSRTPPPKPMSAKEKAIRREAKNR